MINRQPTLIEAAHAGDLKTVQQLLAIKETNIDEQDSNGTTALMAAVDSNDVNMVNALLIWGADIKKFDKNRMTALMIAAEKGYSEIVYQLVVMKAALQVENIQALGLAVKAGHLNIVRMLLAHGASPISVIDGHTAPEYVAATNNLAMARELLAYRANFNTPYAMQIAVDRGHIDMVLLFASYEEDAGVALNMAAKAGNAEMVSALLANHVKIGAKNDIGYSALMTASEFGHINVVNVLLAHPEAAKTINQTDNSKQTALMYAARMKHLDIARALLAAGADIHLQDAAGNTALLYAIDSRMKSYSSDFLNELLIWGANTQNLENAWEESVFSQHIKEHVKERKNYEEMEKKLSEIRDTFFFPKALVNIIVDEYASPTVQVKRAKKQ